ncbi:glycosyltransferase [Lysobacter sp. A6]|uniref:Glycosyltransferase n=1 Tax=Noviluteimonas lactosilytica TaxID=2888523 RepID=A0ABS8JH72_9GAMM|nr:glycosyltransferase [Lysobacter lactosilyticus]MCC8362932.1 glycosyltransferase [Lysobacter lactosilyticus]
MPAPDRPASDLHAHDRPALDRPVRVLHFVTGGFSGGATQVAIALVQAGVDSPDIEPLLVLRRKRRTDPRRIAELEQAGVPLRVVPGWSHAATIWSLVKLCREFKPDVLVAHGFSEHLWGRYAGLLANVPHLVHVEHNTRERYTAWRLKQARWLARRTDRIVGCSEGVRLRLLETGMPPERTIAIPNGIRLAPFAEADQHPVAQRTRGIVMVARLSKQKDHATLIRAVARLRDRGIVVPVLFAGGGKKRHRAPLDRLVALLGVQDQVRFLGVARNVPELLMTHRVAALATHWEGMPLALIEGMAAGCAVVGSAVPGVREVIDDGVDGRLVAEHDDAALADVLATLLTDDAQATRLGAAARASAQEKYGRELMHARYEALFLELARGG